LAREIICIELVRDEKRIINFLVLHTITNRHETVIGVYRATVL